MVSQVIVDLNLDSKKILVVGGGKEGMRKVRGMLGQGCEILVIDKYVNKELRSLEHDGMIKIIRHKLSDLSFLDEFSNIFILMAATDDKLLNRKIIEKGQAMGALVYAADDPLVSNFSYASLVTIQGIMQIAISTYGKSPLMARKIRMRIERILRRVIKTTDLDTIVLQDFARNLAKKRIATSKDRRKFLYSIMKNAEIKDAIGTGNLEAAKEITRRLINDRLVFENK
ncbi:MAG TPA: bifunctional precorrin-2 dehydrogenase/sirohydrochlorin ferrochelatase [Nitrososphaeraceae archaeon]